MSSFLTKMRQLFASEPKNERGTEDVYLPLPSDYSHRVTRLMSYGWSRPLAMKGLEMAEPSCDVQAADEWLQERYPTNRAGGTVSPTAASSSSSQLPPMRAKTAMDLDTTISAYEKLPPMPIRNNSMKRPISAASSTSVSPSGPSTSSSSSSSSSSSFNNSNHPMGDIFSTSTDSAHSFPQSSSLSSSQLPSSWECQICTYLNSSSLQSCEMCSTPRPVDLKLGAFTDCIICFSTMPRDHMFMSKVASSTCQHFLCADCAQMYVTSKLDTGIIHGGIQCPHEQCQRAWTEEELRSATDEYDYGRYLRYARINALQNDASFIFCPSVGCENVLKYTGRPKLLCPCGLAMCYHCKTPWHYGLACSQYQVERERESESQRLARLSIEERLFEKFLEKNGKHFKRCKRCTAVIEKVEGCEKMTCRCGYQFCHKCGIENATCHCTPFGHVFYSHETVLNNWGRPTESNHRTRQSSGVSNQSTSSTTSIFPNPIAIIFGNQNR